MKKEKIDPKIREFVEAQYSPIIGDLAQSDKDYSQHAKKVILTSRIHREAEANNIQIEVATILQVIREAKAKEKRGKPGESNAVPIIITLVIFFLLGMWIFNAVQEVRNRTPQDEWREEVNKDYNKFINEAEKRGIVK